MSTTPQISVDISNPAVTACFTKLLEHLQAAPQAGITCAQLRQKLVQEFGQKTTDLTLGSSLVKATPA